MPERRVSMTDGLAERVIRLAVSSLANHYPEAPERATAAKEMLVRVLEGRVDDADAVDGYAAAVVLVALARGVEAQAGSGLDWLAVAAIEEWDAHHPESPF